MPSEDRLAALLRRKRESKTLEFKRSFDVNQKSDWCELIKDIVAMANSGGGTIIIGLNNDGSPSGEDVAGVLALDNAEFMDKIGSYTGSQSLELDVTGANKGGHPVAVITIGAVASPLVFVKPGTYPISGGRQNTAFGKGTVYFRHGAKSEPANSEDLPRFIEKERQRHAKDLMDNVRKVVEAPRGHRVVVVAEGTEDALRVAAVPRENVPKGTPVIAVEDRQKYCTLRFTEVEQQTGVRGNYLSALIRELGIRDNEEMALRIPYGRQEIWKYSNKAVEKIKRAARELDLRKVYRKHYPPRKRVSGTKATE